MIQPQVPLRLPCYDFAPVTELTFGGCPLAVSPPTSGPPRFTPDPTCRALLRKSTTGSAWSSRTGLSPSLAPHSRGLRLTSLPASVAPTTPIPQGDRFRLGPVRSPLLRASQLISLPLGTEMFQFPRFASRLRGMTTLARRRVSPFGHPGINACVPLPLAYRSLPRPSSPSCAQASSICFRSLDYKFCSYKARAFLSRVTKL